MLTVYTSGGARLFAAVALMLATAVPAAAQVAVRSADIQRLQDEVLQADNEVASLRTSNPEMATRLEAELEDLSDEVTYLKVKLRRERTVTRREYVDVRTRLQNLRTRTRDESGLRGDTRGTGGVRGGTQGSVPAYPPDDRSREERPRYEERPRAQGDSAIPIGQEIDVRLQTALTSDTAQVEDWFEATTLVDLYSGNRVLIPAGSMMRGVVRTVDRASRTDRKGSMTVSFDQVTISGRSYPMRGTVTQALESEGIRGETARIGTAAGVGAIIGGIIGGVKGALLGVLIGGGGTIAATEGKDVHLQPGTILRVRLDTPPALR